MPPTPSQSLKSRTTALRPILDTYVTCADGSFFHFTKIPGCTAQQVTNGTVTTAPDGQQLQPPTAQPVRIDFRDAQQMGWTISGQTQALTRAEEVHAGPDRVMDLTARYSELSHLLPLTGCG